MINFASFYLSRDFPQDQTFKSLINSKAFTSKLSSLSFLSRLIIKYYAQDTKKTAQNSGRNSTDIDCLCRFCLSSPLAFLLPLDSITTNPRQFSTQEKGKKKKRTEHLGEKGSDERLKAMNVKRERAKEINIFI